MKKLLLLAAAFIATATAFAQENLALGAKMYSTCAIQNGSVENLVDGNMTTIWQPHTIVDGTVTHDEWFTAELNDIVEFNKITISWNGDRWSSTFEISTSEDGEKWTVIYNGKNEESVQGKVVEYELKNIFKSKYIKFQNVERNINDEWGVNIGEFMVQNTESTVPYLTGKNVDGADYPIISGTVDSQEDLDVLNALMTGPSYDISNVEFTDVKFKKLKPANPNTLISVGEFKGEKIDTEFTGANFVVRDGVFYPVPITDMNFDATSNGYPVYTRTHLCYKSEIAQETAPLKFTFTRTIPVGRYVTGVFPGNVETLPEGLKVYTLTDGDKNGITLTSQSKIEDNVPYVLYATKEVIVKIVEEYTGFFDKQFAKDVSEKKIENCPVTFKGTYADIAGDASTMYGIYNQTSEDDLHLGVIGTTAKVGPFRCYFVKENATSGAKTMSINFIDGGTTGINNLATETGVKADKIYTIDGRMVNNSLGNLAKGLYIVNGKKVIIK